MAISLQILTERLKCDFLKGRVVINDAYLLLYIALIDTEHFENYQKNEPLPLYLAIDNEHRQEEVLSFIMNLKTHVY